MDVFSSVPVKFGLDLAVVAIALTASAFVLRRYRDIVRTKALWGAALVLGGLWALTFTFIADLFTMTLMPSEFGQSVAAPSLTGLHAICGWYSTTAAAAMTALGLAMMLSQILRQARLQRSQLERLEMHQNHFQQAAELAKVGYYIYDPAKEKVEFFTDTHARNHGVGRAKYAQSASTLKNGMPLIHPDDRDRLLEGYKRVQLGETVRLAYRTVHNDGAQQVREIVKPIFDDDGKIIRELGTTLDVSEHIETEKLLSLVQRNKAIGQLTGGIAHDFNNLLAVIMGNLEILSEELSARKVDPALWEESANAALSASRRGAELVKSLLSFARQADLKPESVDLNNLISETDGWLRRTLPSNIGTEISLYPGLWKTHIDRNEAQNALVNLILNARNAMPDGGKLTIETSNVHVSEDYIREHEEELDPGRYVLMAVSDTGTGMKPDHIERIFDPFFSTRPPGEGSGLGLSMVQGFVRQSGGTIRVYSEEGIGTTFKLYFPTNTSLLDVETETDKPCHRQVAEETPANARVLFAEDQDDLAELILRTLKIAGLDVTSARSGDAAYEIFRNDPDFDLLLTDIVMPGALQGPALAKEIRKLDPNLPVIFMSGYAAEAAIHGNGLRPEDIRLMKPIPKSELLEAIQKALHHRIKGTR